MIKSGKFRKSVSLPHKIQAMKRRTYKTKITHLSEAQEPRVPYGIFRKNSVIPDGYMSLSQFGDVFHQKLDTSYENIYCDSQQNGNIRLK